MQASLPTYHVMILKSELCKQAKLIEEHHPDLIFHLVCYLIALGLLTIKWFNIMPHLSLFSFCDETLVTVIF